MKALELLTKYELTSSQLASRLQITKSTVRHHVKNLREAGQVRIVRWEKSGKQTVPVYGAGSGKDAPKPPPIDRIVLRYKYNERNRARVRLSQRKTPVTPWDVLGVVGVNWGRV
jgi:DNA-binding transcriptional ArsR family regulator